MPKIVESFELANILPGEGVNLDDDDALNALKTDALDDIVRNVAPLSAPEIETAELHAVSGRDDTVSADFIPPVRAEYKTRGIAAMETENESNTARKPVYTARAATCFETDDYLVRSPLPVLMTAQISLADFSKQHEKEIR